MSTVQSYFNSSRMGKLSSLSFAILAIICFSILSCVSAQCQFESDGVSDFLTNLMIGKIKILRRPSCQIHGRAPVIFGAGRAESSIEIVIAEWSLILLIGSADRHMARRFKEIRALTGPTTRSCLIPTTEMDSSGAAEDNQSSATARSDLNSTRSILFVSDREATIILA